MRNEIEIQETIRKFLESKDIIPFEVIYTNEFGGVLSITLFMKDDLKNLLKILDYKSMCDKSGFRIMKNTVVLSGMALLSFLYNEKEY